MRNEIQSILGNVKVRFDPDKRYQKIPELEFMEIVRRRKLSPAETSIAILLRGKCLRFGNPFFLCDSQFSIETGWSIQVIRRLRKKLQIKGVLMFDPSHGKGKYIKYTMLDSAVPYNTENLLNSICKPIKNNRFPYI